MRQSGWERTRRWIERQLKRGKSLNTEIDFDPDHPWECVIESCTLDKRWWDEHITEVISDMERAMGRPNPAAAAQQFDAALSPGLLQPPPAPHWASRDRNTRTPAPSPQQPNQPQHPSRPVKGKNKGGNSNRRDKGGGKGVIGKKLKQQMPTSSDGQELCYKWNKHPDGCQTVCPHPRTHLCTQCRGPHRECSGECTGKPYKF